MSNLPKLNPQDSARFTRQFFDQYFTKTVTFPANEIDAVIGFFEKNGFEKTSATSLATVLLTQAKLDNIKTFRLLDTLKGLDELQLNAVVSEVLNYNREKISSLGFRTTTPNTLESRNIIDDTIAPDITVQQQSIERNYVHLGYVQEGYINTGIINSSSPYGPLDYFEDGYVE
jgi:hypothetical protein